jgi:hypothetical protein
MPWHMFYFGDLQRKTIPDQLFAFAQANLDSADSLCATLCAKTAGATYAHGAVILSLTFHALELFLKAAILQKSPSEQFGGRSGHDLAQLSKRYSNLHHGKDMSFHIPFARELPDAHGLDPQVAKELIAYVREQDKKMPQDQLHRYPTSVNGETWNAALGFEPNSFRITIQQLQHDFADIKPRVQAG